MSKLVHWEIPSTDLEKSKGFYTELFGWQMFYCPACPKLGISPIFFAM